MLIEQTGRYSAVILLDENDCRERQFLLKSICSKLDTDKNIGFEPKIITFDRGGKTLVFMELIPCEKFFCFDGNDSFIDAVRRLGKLCAYCELFGDKHGVYIKSKNPAAWNILSEYGRVYGECKDLHKIGGQDVFDRIIGG